MVEILNDIDLEKVCGGAFTDEALAWLQRNIDKLFERMDKKKAADFSIVVLAMGCHERQFNLEEVKSVIKEQYEVDISDLV